MADTGKSGKPYPPQGTGTGQRQQGIQETASDLGQRAKESVSNLTGSAQDLARRAQDVAGQVGQRAGEAVSGIGEQMENLAERIRERGPEEGVLGSTASSLAEGLEAGGRYLQEQDFSDMVDDVAAMVRRYPLQAVLVGIGIGFLLGRTGRR